MLAAFRDYLAHYNHGRGIVFIGHSQGATILIRLLQQEVDASPALRGRLVSALLLGGNVTVAKGPQRRRRLRPHPGLHVAPADRLRRRLLELHHEAARRTASSAGRAPMRASACSPRARRDPNLQIMCVNPASPGGGAGAARPVHPLARARLRRRAALPATTPWVAFPGEYAARCEDVRATRRWLQVARRAGGADERPLLTRLQEPILGLHILDVNIALGNLVELVGRQAASYRHP